MIVILNEVKNLIISTESIVEILRLMPQNDIATQSLKREGLSCLSVSPRMVFHNFFDNIDQNSPSV